MTLKIFYIFICLYTEVSAEICLKTKSVHTVDLLKLLEKVTDSKFKFNEKNSQTCALTKKYQNISDILSEICCNSKPKLTYSKNGDSYILHKQLQSKSSSKKNDKKTNYKHKVIPLHHIKTDKNFETSIENFWNKKLQDKNKNLLTIDTDKHIIIARGTDVELQKLQNFIDEIDKPTTRIRLDIMLISIESAKNLATGINWSGIYNRLQMIKNLNKNFDFAGLGGTLFDIPTATTHLSSPIRTFGNLFVNPDNFAINTFTGAISSDYGQLESQNILRLPFVFGGPDLNLSRLNLLLNANEVDNAVKIISKPSLVTNNDQLSKLLIGQDIPFYSAVNQIVVTEPNTFPVSFNSFPILFYRDVGISMQIRPNADKNKKLIAIEVFLEFSEIISGDNLGITGDGILRNPPVLELIKTKSKVVLENGQTVIISGSSALRKQQQFNQAPYFKEIPIAGQLFSSKGQKKIEEEDFIMITPIIIE